MTDNQEEQKASNFTPEIAKLNRRNKISVLPAIASISAIVLILSGWIYLSYFSGGENKKNSSENKVKSESEIIKKEFTFKKDKQEIAVQPPTEQSKEERSFNIGHKDTEIKKPVFKKYKSIPAKSDETTDSSDSNSNKELASNNVEDSIVVETIKIDPNFLIPEGTYIPCSLMTRFVSDVAGRIQCTISEDVYSSNGSVKLIEKGTKAIGVYQSGTLQHGVGRMFVIWTKLITPDFKRINLVDTQVVGQLGEAGINGSIDSHFWQRFGGALMLSVVKDVMRFAAVRQEKQNNNVVNINNIDNTKDTFVTIVEKMLDNSINIAPTMYKNQGDIIGILVGKDIDFSKVYKLKLNK